MTAHDSSESLVQGIRLSLPTIIQTSSITQILMHVDRPTGPRLQVEERHPGSAGSSQLLDQPAGRMPEEDVAFIGG